MPTPNIEELIAVLHEHAAQQYELSRLPLGHAYTQAANALQSQAERIKELEAAAKYTEQIDLDEADELAKVTEERDTLRAQLATLQVDDELPEPAGKLRSDEFDGHVFEPSQGWPFGDLYTADQLRQAQARVRARLAQEQESSMEDLQISEIGNEVKAREIGNEVKAREIEALRAKMAPLTPEQTAKAVAAWFDESIAFKGFGGRMNAAIEAAMGSTGEPK